MTIYWDGLPDSAQKNKYEPFVKKTLEYMKAPKSSEVSITITGSEEILSLNKEYRNIDEPTDVLSFPLSDVPEWTNERPIALGDVVISIDAAHDQANSYGHSLERELAFLMVHGLLHLGGYDHMNREDENKMRQAQRDILGDLI